MPFVSEIKASAFGLSPLGTDYGPFGGPGLISVLGVLPESHNSIIVVFDVAPRADDYESSFSATNHNLYQISAVDPYYTDSDGASIYVGPYNQASRQLTIVHAEPASVDIKQIRLYTDATMDDNVLYEVSIPTTIKTENCDSFVGPDTFSFVSRLRGAVVADGNQVLRYSDLAYQLYPQPGTTPQVYNYDDTGDIAIHGPDESLRKRILRRLLTTPNGFSFLAGYGTNLGLKSLAKPGTLQSRANVIAEQVRLEPDVLGAVAGIRTQRAPGGLIVIVDVRVVQQDRREKQFLYQFPAG